MHEETRIDTSRGVAAWATGLCATTIKKGTALPHLRPRPAPSSACSRHLGRQATLALMSIFFWQIMSSAL
eukprot:scaffold132472_cov36-Cyclotella_meneghiniana.AAC.1